MEILAFDFMHVTTSDPQFYDSVLRDVLLYSYRMASNYEKRGWMTFRDHCQVCGAHSLHVYRHILRVHLPWYVNPTTSCVDCHVSAGNARELQNMNGRHRLFSGEHLLQAWFLLLNGLFLFISQEIGLRSPMELLGCAAIQELSSFPLRFSEDEYFFLREYDREPVWNHFLWVIKLQLPELDSLSYPPSAFDATNPPSQQSGNGKA